MTQPWTVVVPVKRLAAAKTRLRGGLPGVPHQDLALALAADTLAAVRACPVVSEVLVVTDDARVAGERPGPVVARILPDVADAGLNAAFRHGRGGRRTGPRVRRFVADAPGTGTVLLAAPPGVPLDPRFGPDSAARHSPVTGRACGATWTPPTTWPPRRGSDWGRAPRR